MEAYIKVDIEKYVREGLENGRLVSRQAFKVAPVMARHGKIGEKIVSWSVDSDGNEVQEKVAVVGIDEITYKPDWVITKVDRSGNVVIDCNGHFNEWVVKDSVFQNKYESEFENLGLFRPKDDKQIFVQIPDDILFIKRDVPMYIAAGGYINITNFYDMYGISKKDFEDTYCFSDDLEIKCLKKQDI